MIKRNEEEEERNRDHDLRFGGAGDDGGAVPAPQELPPLRGALAIAVQIRAVRFIPLTKRICLRFA